MRLRAAPLAACALALVSCGQEQAGEPVMRTEIGSGVADTQASPTPSIAATIEAEREGSPSACRDVEFEGSQLTHCVADPARHRIGTALAPEDGAPFRSLKAFSETVEQSHIAFAMNAGMYDGEGKPIGYYVEDGDRLKELSRADGPGNFHLKPNGVFYGTEGQWRVRSSDSFYANVGDRPAFGTQSGPMLVIDGKLHPEISDDGPSKATRNGVGVDRNGKAHFVIANSSVSFGRLARYFRDEVKTPNALFLDGNVSALWDPATERMDSSSAIGPLLVVTHKE